jgi:LacI family transcriptional regulator
VQGGYYGASQLMKLFAPTAILGGNDMCAIGVMHWAADNGVSVPAQLSVVGYDNISFAPFTQPPLTTVALPRAEIGRMVFLALKELQESETHEGKEYRVRPSLVVRQSTAPPPAVPVQA